MITSLQNIQNSMTRFSRRINPTAAQVAAFFFLCVSLFSSCRKYDDEIGYNLLNNTGLAEGIVVDSLEIVTYTVKEDSIRVDSLSSSILGAINDPEFGLSSSNVYVQCLLQEINIDFGTNPQLDSIVLAVAMTKEINSYGYVNGSPMDIEVYKMNEQLIRSNKYYSNYAPAIGDKVGTWNGRLNVSDTTWYNDKGVLKSKAGYMRIRLDDAFGQDFFTANAYGSNESFLQFLNGFAMIPNTSSLSSGQGSIVPLNLNSVDSKLIIYFNDTLQKEFVITDKSERAMHYSTATANSDITTQLANPGTHYSETYLQAMGAFKTKIEIPNLYDIVKSEGQIIVNEAVLTLTVKEGSTSDDLPAPTRLLLVQPSKDDGTGENTLIKDLIDVVAPSSASWVGFTNYGGRLSEDGKTYTFRFNRHLQDLYNSYLATGEEINRGFYVIVPSDNPITPSRLILDTKNDQNIQNIRFKITYTKL